MQILQRSPLSTGPNFELSQEQKNIQEIARKFAKNEILPVATHHDRTGEFPADIIKKAWEIGLLNLYIPADCGGPELDCMTDCVISEELAHACTGIGISLVITDVAVILFFF